MSLYAKIYSSGSGSDYVRAVGQPPFYVAPISNKDPLALVAGEVTNFYNQTAGPSSVDKMAFYDSEVSGRYIVGGKSEWENFARVSG